MQLCHLLWLYSSDSWSKLFTKPKVCSQTAVIIENPDMYVDGVYPIKFESVNYYVLGSVLSGSQFPWCHGWPDFPQVKSGTFR